MKEQSLFKWKVLLFMCTFTMSFGTFAQSVIVKGTVIDPNNEALPGVTITIVGTTKGVITDINGNYSIEANSNDHLLFSFVLQRQPLLPHPVRQLAPKF